MDNLITSSEFCIRFPFINYGWEFGAPLILHLDAAFKAKIIDLFAYSKQNT